jgi:1-acyl-sn-glycerol-3-phosphate acyltransferase
MTLDEARRAGRVPPAGWPPPRPDRLIDAARTALVVARVASRFVRALRAPVGAVGDTTTAAGLLRLQHECRGILEALGVRVEVEHAGRVPGDGGLVLMWNQTSHLDHAILPLAIPRPFHSTYNNEVRRLPLYGSYLARSDHFWLDRTDEVQWRSQLAACAGRVRAGACVLVSPEGTRSWDGRLLPMKRGAFLLAREAGRPIVCVTVIGAQQLLPRGRRAVRPGSVRVVFGEPIEVDPGTSPRLEQLVVAAFERELAASP